MGDAEHYETFAASLLGKPCAATLATNSIKLAFGHRGMGCPYIWIDPPWRLEHDGHCVVTASEYSDDTFSNWSALLGPLREATLTAWFDGAGATIFAFDGGHRLVVPWKNGDVADESWYSHWYATGGTG